MNIDRQIRDRYAELLRHFAAGRLTNDQYEDASDWCLESPDPALRALWRAMWSTCDDLHEHRLTGEYELSRDGRATVARMVLFLRSDLPYEWPTAFRSLGILLLNLLTLGLWSRIQPPPVGSGDEAVWPFFRAEDLAQAATRPRFLGAARSPEISTSN